MQYIYEQKHRVNFVLSHKLHSYLVTAADVGHVSKSTYLRDLIQRDMERKWELEEQGYASDGLLQIIANALATTTLANDSLPQDIRATHQALAKSILVQLMEWRG